MAGPSLIPLNIAGGINFTAPTYKWGDTSQQINGGYSFDLPLSTVANFTNAALSFSNANTQNAQGFLSGVIAGAQSNVSAVARQSFDFANSSMGILERLGQGALDNKKYEIKKKYSTANLLKPGSNCFITTAICKAEGKGDKCAELQLLRRFRDEVIAETEGGAELIDRYYRLAPLIVAALDVLPTAADEYHRLRWNFLSIAIDQIAAGMNSEAIATYGAMVEHARKLTGVVEPEPVDPSELGESDYQQKAVIFYGD